MAVEYRHTVLALALAAFFGTMVARLAISPVVPAITGSFDVSKGAIGLALTGMWAAYALVQFPSGVLGDRFGERSIVLAALGLTGLGSALLSLSPSYRLFVSFAVLLGAGAGLCYSPAASLLTKLFERTGAALGVLAAGGPLGGLFAPVVAAYVGVRYGWRSALLLGVAVTVPAAVLLAWRVAPTPADRPDATMRDRLDLSTIVELLSRPQIAFTTGLAVVGYFCFQSFVSFFPTFLIEDHGFGSQRASLVFGAVFALSVGGNPLLGRLSDRLNRDYVLATSLSAAAAGFWLFLGDPDPGPVAVVAGTGLLGVGFSWNGVITSRFMDHLSDSERGAGLGLVRTVFMLLGSLGSVVVGTLADTAGWLVAYGLVAGLFVLAAATIGIARIVDADL